jgi:hypothetical protein
MPKWTHYHCSQNSAALVICPFSGMAALSAQMLSCSSHVPGHPPWRSVKSPGNNHLNLQLLPYLSILLHPIPPHTHTPIRPLSSVAGTRAIAFWECLSWIMVIAPFPPLKPRGKSSNIISLLNTLSWLPSLWGHSPHFWTWLTQTLIQPLPTLPATFLRS